MKTKMTDVFKIREARIRVPTAPVPKDDTPSKGVSWIMISLDNRT